MLKISFPGCLGLYPVISTQFTLELCVAASFEGNLLTRRHQITS